VVWASTIGAVAGPNLAAPVGGMVAGTGIPVLAAPYLASAATFLVCAVWLTLMLRPDPLQLAKRLGPQEEPQTAGPGVRGEARSRSPTGTPRRRPPGSASARWPARSGRSPARGSAWPRWRSATSSWSA